MAVNAKAEFDIDAPPSVVMEVLMDIEALPDWSDPHKSAKVITTHDDGTPLRCELAVTGAGITDEQVLDYSWTDNTCSWVLVESGQLSQQQGQYTVTPKGDGSHVVFDLTIDLKIKLPGFIVKKAPKIAVETAKKGLTAESEKRAKQ